MIDPLFFRINMPNTYGHLIRTSIYWPANKTEQVKFAMPISPRTSDWTSGNNVSLSSESLLAWGLRLLPEVLPEVRCAREKRLELRGFEQLSFCFLLLILQTIITWLLSRACFRSSFNIFYISVNALFNSKINSGIIYSSYLMKFE